MNVVVGCAGAVSCSAIIRMVIVALPGAEEF